MRRFFQATVAALACSSALLGNLLALEPRDFVVELSAQVQTSPPQIRLSWPASSFASSFSISRKLLQEQSWNSLGNLPGSATFFTDVSVVAGAAYEYQIAQASSDGLTAYGYIYAGMEVPFVPERGRLVLVVDSTYAAPLDAELARLKADLVGDGWAVLRHDVPRTASPRQVKAVIQAEYNAAPANTRAVLLFGHVPVPYAGDINPDLHPSHRGAWPADVFYGDMNASWSDDSVNDTSAEDLRNHNVPGDGKFDQSSPAGVVLQIGRIDLSDLLAFAPATELDLLRQYLNKNHSYRHRLFDVARRGLIRDNFGEIEGDAPAADAWRSFAPFFGSGNVTVVGPGDFFPTLSSDSFLWAYGGGGGEYYQSDGVGSTTDFARQSPRCVFYMLDGSYFGDWDSTDNFLRAALASPGQGLAAAWTGLPHWFFHHMALGETIGLSTLITQNNRDLYKNHVNLAAGQVHIALMGDPTLRMHVVAPPSNLSAAADGTGASALRWTPSSDSIKGYYVYRGASPSGPFARLTRSFLTTPSYLDTAAPAGPNTYMVRAVKLETSASGTYYNPSQGIFASINSSSGQVLPVVRIETSGASAQKLGPIPGNFVITRDPAANNALQISFSIAGTAVNGTDYETISDSLIIPPNATTGWITIVPIADGSSDHGDKSVILTLNGAAVYTVGSPPTATLTILDPQPNQPPILSTIPDIAVTENTATAPIAFTVSDPETAAENLQVSATTTDSDLVPPDNILFSGTGTARSLVIKPATNILGTTSITVTVTDGLLATSRSFKLSVLGPARIQSIAQQPGGIISIAFSGSEGAYTVQTSKDLRSWTDIGSGVSSSTAQTSFAAEQPSDGSCRFYRVAWP